MKILIKTYLLFSTFCLTLSCAFGQNQLEDYTNVLRKEGKDPLSFVNTLLDQHDLLIFDDALHLAKEPFDFYIELVKDEIFQSKVNYLFIEVFDITTQKNIDDYLSAPSKDRTKLYPVFQTGYSGYGWRYETYLDLLEAVWEVNSTLPEDEKIKVIGVDQPIYWEGIETREDYNVFQQSLTVRDYFMYKIIYENMEGFEKNMKGVFLTNTRHSYKHIRNSKGMLYWNTGTFFNQWHPGKSYSIRLHNIILNIESKREVTNGSTEGLDQTNYSWKRMENGIWDQAFSSYGNTPVGFSLKDNPFGTAKYVGNHMLDVARDQTIYDAYDGLIFLAPLEELHFSANTDFYFTDEFKVELKRRIKLLQGENLDEYLLRNDVESLDEFVELLAQYVPSRPNSLIPKK